MKNFFTKQVFPIAAILITMLVVGFGVSAKLASADLDLNPILVTRTLTYTSNGHGTIQGVTPQVVNNWASGTTVTAVPNTGYSFSQWSDGVTTASRTDTNVTSNINVSATFVLSSLSQFNPNNIPIIPSQNLFNSHTINYSAAGNHGIILGTNPQTVLNGADGTPVTAVAKPHYVFDGWSDGLNSATRTDTNVLSDLNIVASFVQETLNSEDIVPSYLVTYNVPSGRGYIQGSDSQWVLEGQDGTTVKAIPYSGYKFTKWSDGSTNATRKDTDVTENLELTAIFGTTGGGGGGQTADQILGSGACPLDLTLTQNLKSGAHDGEYLKYNGGIVTQVNILQKQINRILAASYNQAAGPIDGRFGPLTKLGVQRLQLALVDILHADLGPKGADGVIGFYTRAAINNSCGGM